MLGVSKRYSSLFDFFVTNCWIKYDELMCGRCQSFLHATDILGRAFSICNVCALLFVLLLLFNCIGGGGTRLLSLFTAFQLVVTM